MSPSRRGLLQGLFALPAALPALSLAARPEVARAGLPEALGDVSQDEAFWAGLRWQFCFPADEAYFNTGSLGACPRPVLEAVHQHALGVAEGITRWDFHPDAPPAYAGYRPELVLRAKLARLLGCEMADVAVTHNSTMGMSMVAAGLELERGAEILISDEEHPGGRCPWALAAARHGAELRSFSIRQESPEAILEDVAAAMSRKTQVLVFSHVSHVSGAVLPAKALCALARERGALSVVDGAQAPGQIVVDLADMGCDVYVSSPHKWLLAPTGTGLLYARPEAQGRLWTTLASAQWDNQEDGAFRFMQYGTRNPSLLAGLEAALDLFHALGADAVARRDRALADALREGLTELPGVRVESPTHPELAGAMVVWAKEGLDGEALMRGLWREGKLRVRPSGKTRVRQSCHLYNSMAEIERTLEAARRLS
ncbi:MAG: aminotransferase class V-fold PLP-dependent enzyme [Alphaproteobacteria bacterium]|nr:aminotransferase class V-fold PLP-dependent enzyme [Alphaproteobacteria bacterium]